MKKIILDLGILLATAIFLISFYCFLHGSFEIYPTSEQTEKARIAAAIAAGLSVFANVILIRSRLKLRERKRNRS